MPALGMSLAGRLQGRDFAVIGCAGYILTFAAPVPWDLSLIVLGVCGILAAIRGSRTVAYLRIPLMPETALFLSTVLLSTIFAKDIIRSLTFSAALVPAALLFYLFAAHFRTMKDLRQPYVAFIAVSLALSAGILAIAWWNPSLGPRDWIGLLGVPILVVPNDAILMAAVAPFCVAMLNADDQPWVKALAAAALVVTLTAIIVLQSRGAMLTFLFECGLMVIRQRPRHALAGLLAVCLLFVVVDGLLGFPMVGKLGFLNDRLSLWLAAGAMFLDHPVLGYGPHTYELFYGAKLAQFDLPEWLPVGEEITPWPHSLYLEVAAEQGVVGLAALGVLLTRALTLLQRARSGLTDAARTYLSACSCSLLAFLVAGAFELTLLRIWVPVLLFLLLGTVSFLAHSPDLRREARLQKDRS